MAWPDLHYEQTNLPLLCAERIIYPHEYHVQNELYGLNSLLKEYADIPQDEPLPWAMEHAISFDNPEPYPADVRTPLPMVLALSKAQAEILRRHIPAQVHAIGSAYHYMLRLYERRRPNQPAVTERRGTLVFPDKSTTQMDTDFDRERFARELASLPDEYQPIAVSIFWRDFQRGTHRPFEQAGLIVVSSGHPYDPLFLFRQYDLCRQFKYACANDLSTSFCLSVLAGCRFFHWPTGPLQMKRKGVVEVHEQEPTLHLPGKQLCLAASRFPPTADATEQKRLAERFSGADSVRTPEFFRQLFAEGHKLLQAAPRQPVDFDQVQELHEIAAWLPRGIDKDGWAQARCDLVLRPQPGYEAVRFSLFIPRGHRPKTELIVSVDGKGSHTFELRCGHWCLEAPLHKPCRITFKCSQDALLAGEPRRRAFRLLAITWKKQRWRCPWFGRVRYGRAA